MREWMSESVEETQRMATELAGIIPPGTVVTLEGVLGSGKTAFAQGFGRALGVKRAIKSPTYTIIKEYPAEDGKSFVHMDAYRLEEGGADSVDLPSFLTEDRYILIEWARFIEEELPDAWLALALSVVSENQRMIRAEVVGESSALEGVLEKWARAVERVRE